MKLDQPFGRRPSFGAAGSHGPEQAVRVRFSIDGQSTRLALAGR